MTTPQSGQTSLDLQHQQARPVSFSAPRLSYVEQPAPLSRSIPPVNHAEIIPGFQVSFEEADRLLDLYRTDYCTSFPFVTILPDMAAYDLFADRPFLFRTIIQVVAPQDAAVQQEVKLWFRKYIADHMIIQQEKSLELLQAILVFVAWYVWHLPRPSHRHADSGAYLVARGDFTLHLESNTTNLLQLAIALVIELGLSKPPRSSVPRSQPLVDTAPSARGIGMKPNSLEEMRALLGCFYLSSV